MGKKGKPPPVTEAELVYKFQGNGWEVSLRSKRFDRTLRMVRRRWQPQIFLTTVNYLCGHCPPRVREADLDYRVESSSLQSSLAQRRTACDPLLVHPSFLLGHRATGKGLPQQAGTTQSPHSEGVSVTQEQHLESNRWLPEWPGATLEWQTGLTC